MPTRLFNNFFPDNIVTLVTQRDVDFSFPSDERAFTQEQDDYLNRELSGFDSRIAQVRQVHGDEIVCLRETCAPVRPEICDHVGAEPTQADGIITQLKNVGIGVRTADCLPVFLFDPIEQAVGMVHAGWRGTQKRIIQKAINKMIAEFGVQAQNLMVALGPCIRLCCYRVGAEFLLDFPNTVEQRDQRYYFSLNKENTQQIIDSGVKGENVFDCNICTCCEKDYFSYRREGEAAGRTFSLIVLKD